MRIDRLLGIILSAVLILSSPINAVAQSDHYENDKYPMISGYATAYCVSGNCAGGGTTREGICASSMDRMDCMIVMYQRLPDGRVGNYIGMYEVKDTGGTGVSSGKVIDVWKPDLDACQEFMNLLYEDGCQGRVYFQVIPAVG